MGGTRPRDGTAVRRVFGGVLLCGAAIVVSGFFGAGSAYGLTVTDQDASVDNTGAAVANSGGNAAVGNVQAGDQTAVNAQGAATGGGIAANTGSATNESKGSATIVTGSATAAGNESSTGASQSANSAGGGGLNVASQDADVDNAGVGVANSGLNGAVGNVQAGDQTAVNGQLALAGGGAAFNTGRASNVSAGAATIVTGPAGALGNQSATGISQGANGLGSGLGITIQDADVDNFGVGIANSGLNGAVGNVQAGDQTAVNLQGAFTLFGVAVNAGGASNVSTGDATIVTGPAGAVGNRSTTGIGQSATTLGGWFPGVTLQDVAVDNFGVGIANSGLNGAVGNVTGDQVAVNIGLALGLGGLGVNTGGASNVSTGSSTIVTGGAGALGNSSNTSVSQAATTTGTPFVWAPWWWALFGWI
jgi:hypothetical protein